MKLITDERVKHRLVGLAVILSIAAIFAPAIMKKSSQRFDENVSMSLELPARPKMPKMAIPEQKAMFQTAKIAHVDIPSVNDEQPPVLTIAKAAPISEIDDTELVALTAENEHIPKTSNLEKAVSKKSEAIKPVALKSLPVVKKVEAKRVDNKRVSVIARKPVPASVATKSKAVPSSGYAVQLATFSQQKNAIALIARLKQKGYQAKFNKIVDRKGTVYKVVVGQTHEKPQAQKLQQQLASAMQLQGFVVATKVS